MRPPVTATVEVRIVRCATEIIAEEGDSLLVMGDVCVGVQSAQSQQTTLASTDHAPLEEAEIERQILEMIRAAEGPLSGTVIRRRLGVERVSGEVYRSATVRLIRRGLIERCGLPDDPNKAKKMMLRVRR